MKLPDHTRLLRSTAVRIAARYAILYALLSGAALGAFYWASASYVDAQLHAGLREDFASLRNRYQTQGRTGLIALMEERTRGATEDGRFYLFVDGEKNRLAGNLLGWPPEDPLPLDSEVRALWVEDDIIPVPDYDDDAYWPVIGTEFEDGSRLVVARSVRRSEELQLYSLYALLTLLGVIVLLALTMGVLMSNSILKRIDGITRTAREIMSGDLKQRMPVGPRGDEFDVLSADLNRMLDRIEQLMQGMREVTDNVAHDLRSPLSRLRNRLEITLLERRDEAEYRQAMQQAVDDAGILVKTFNAILQTSQAEAGTVRAGMAPVDLSRLAGELGELFRPAAEESGKRLHLDVEQAVQVKGNRNLLGQAVGNLLDNAIKHTPRGGAIRLQVARSGDGAEIRVRDAGPGIPAEDQKRVLDRFVRLDSSRKTPGNGLGLSLASAIARQHGARLVLENAEPGLVAKIRFPERAAP